MPLATQTSPGGAATDPIRVMVVDDAVVVRGLVSRWLGEDPNIEVVARHRNGRLAVDDMLRADPDVVILDIDMPEMDGMEALPEILAKKPSVQVLMASTLTMRNAEISLRALKLGAADYVPKPESNSGVSTSVDFRRDLVEKVRALGARARRQSGRETATPSTVAERIAARVAARQGELPRPVQPDKPIVLRPFASVKPRILAIGSSTGGPQALSRLLGVIGPQASGIPIVITQHMPPNFTTILAEHLRRDAGRPSAEGRDGEPLMPGRIYVAPGGQHMLLEKTASGVVVRLSDAPPVNYCKPAVDPLFDSVAACFGPAALAVVLTGMGSDGARGATTIAGAGGSVVAQDEASSVVWGMPGATAHAGACSAVLPLDEIGPTLLRIMQGALR